MAFLLAALGLTTSQLVKLLAIGAIAFVCVVFSL